MQVFEGEEASNVIIFDEYSKALEGIEGFDNLIVLYWIHISDRTHLRPKLRSSESDTRSRKKPNPIGISVVKVLKIDGNTIEVKHLDAVDGTPVLDIKPYYGEVDAR